MEKKEKEMDDVHVEVVMPLKQDWGTATIGTAIAAPTGSTNRYSNNSQEKLKKVGATTDCKECECKKTSKEHLWVVETCYVLCAIFSPQCGKTEM